MVYVLPKVSHLSTQFPMSPRSCASVRAEKAAYTEAGSSNRLTGSMKGMKESQLVAVEDFYRRCLQAKKPRLGQFASTRFTGQ